MTTFIMLTRLAHEDLDSPQHLEDMERQMMDRIRRDCPEVKWRESFAVLGPYDYFDVFDAPDVASATKVSTLLRTYGKADVEVWPATEWRQFKEMLHGLPEHAEKPAAHGAHHERPKRPSH